MSGKALLPHIPEKVKLYWYVKKVQVTEVASAVKFRQAARDAGYLLIDVVPTTIKVHSVYGAFHKYLKQAKKGKGINPEDFKDVDTQDLRRMIELFSQTRGPLTGFDFRWFYYIYAIMIAQLVYCAWKLFSLKDQRQDMQSAMSQRKEVYSKDYIEDLRKV